MKKRIIRVILIILIIIWMITVFNLSNNNGEVSSGISLKIAKIISNDKNIIKMLEPILRKLAHLSEYIVGGFLFYGLLLTYNLKSKAQVLCSGILGIVYSITDEIHQLFIPGRSGQVIDVLIDSLGVCIGISILLLIIKIVKIKK